MLSQLLQALFLSETRPYNLAWRDDAGPNLPVEAWWGSAALSGGFEYCIDLLSTDDRLELKSCLGRALKQGRFQVARSGSWRREHGKSRPR